MKRFVIHTHNQTIEYWGRREWTDLLETLAPRRIDPSDVIAIEEYDNG